MAESTGTSLSSLNRAQRPKLCLEDLKKAQDTTYSTTSSTKSSFLSAPLSDIPAGTPPPRPESPYHLDSSRGSKARRNRDSQRSKRRQRCQGGSEVYSIASSPLLAASTDGYFGPHTRELRDQHNLMPAVPFPQRRIKSYCAGAHHEPHTQHASIAANEAHEYNAKDSCLQPRSLAVESLHRIYRSQTMPSFHNQSIPPSVSTSSQLLRSTRSKDGDSAPQDGLDHLLPATIMLRKASVALGAAKSLLHGQHQGRASPANTDHGIENDDMSPHIIAFRSSCFLGDISSGDPQIPVSRERRMSLMVSFGGFENHPCREAAAPALTLTDIYVASQNSSVEAKSGRRSSSFRTAPKKRLSIVQIRSRASVHEVVWQEGESLTSSSRTGSGNRSPDKLPTDDGATQAPSMLLRRSDTLKHNGHGDFEQAQSFAIDDGIFAWSWGQMPAQSPRSNSILVNNDSNAEESLGHDREIRTADKPGLDRPMSDQSQVQSFPPLLPRNCTADWSLLPLVDINDPSAGRTEVSPGANLSESTGSDMDVRVDNAAESEEMANATIAINVEIHDSDGALHSHSIWRDWAAAQRGQNQLRKLSSSPYVLSTTENNSEGKSRRGSALGSSAHQRFQRCNGTNVSA